MSEGIQGLRLRAATFANTQEYTASSEEEKCNIKQTKTELQQPEDSVSKTEISSRKVSNISACNIAGAGKANQQEIKKLVDEPKREEAKPDQVHDKAGFVNSIWRTITTCGGIITRYPVLAAVGVTLISVCCDYISDLYLAGDSADDSGGYLRTRESDLLSSAASVIGNIAYLPAAITVLKAICWFLKPKRK